MDYISMYETPRMVSVVLRDNSPSMVGIIIIILLNLLSLGINITISVVREPQLATGIVVYQLLKYQHISKQIGRKLLTQPYPKIPAFGTSAPP